MTKSHYLIRKVVLAELKRMECETMEIKKKISKLQAEILRLEKEDSENFSTRLEMADFIDKYLEQ